MTNSTGSGKGKGGRKGSTGKASASTRKQNQKRTESYYRREKTEQEKMISTELFLLLLLTITILLFLCNFGIIGPVGNAISGFMFGIFGVLAYVVPVFVFGIIAFKISNAGNFIALIKMAAVIVLFFIAGMFFHIFQGNMKEAQAYSISESYQLGKELKAGGGVIFGSLAYVFYSLLDVVGSVLILLVLAIGCIIIITEKSLFREVKKGSRYVISSAKADAGKRMDKAKRRKEEQEAYRQKRLEQRALEEERRQQDSMKEDAEKILRMEKKVSGVMLDTKLEKKETKPKAVCREDIHEITLQDIQSPVFEQQKDSVPAKEEFSFNHIRIHGAEQTKEEVAVQEKQDIKEIFPSQEYFEEAVPGRENDYMVSAAEYDVEEAAVTERFEEIAPVREEKGYPEEIASVREENEYFEEIMPVREDTERLENTYLTKKEQQFEGEDETDKQKAVIKRPVAKLQELSEKDKIMKAAGQDIKAMREKEKQPAIPYAFPPISYLKRSENSDSKNSMAQLKETAMRLQQTLNTFGVKVAITDISHGPTVTRYELQPEQGVKVSKIVGLADDIKLNLAATDIRMEAPIPGKAAIGIEVPNKENSSVGLRDLLESREFKEFPSKLTFAVGKDIAGKVVVADISKMPHMLIAGSTGSGKSVCINTLIMSILYKAKPDEVKLIMIDPKVVELSVYNGIPHLLIPVVTDPKKAAAALHWGVAEMDDRYRKFADFNVRDLHGYNAEVERRMAAGSEEDMKKMPQIVIIVDELADLMMVAPGEVEESICRLAQLARAAGIHLIIATQRPSVDVITGLIKANMPSRVAFAVSSGVDSRTILDMNGAEKLLGKGDMLFYPQGYPKPVRVQGAFVSDEEVGKIVDFLKNQNIGNVYSEDIEDKIKSMGNAQGTKGGSGAGDGKDAYFVDAAKFIMEKDKASIGMLQRVFKIGFNRAARIMDQLAEAGVVGEEEGTKPRKVLMSPEQFEQYVEEYL